MHSYKRFKNKIKPERTYCIAELREEPDFSQFFNNSSAGSFTESLLDFLDKNIIDYAVNIDGNFEKNWRATSEKIHSLYSKIQNDKDLYQDDIFFIRRLIYRNLQAKDVLNKKIEPYSYEHD